MNMNINNQECFVSEHVLVRLEVQLIHQDAKLPFRERDSDAGYDIYSVENTDLPPGKSKLVKTGIKISCPAGFYYTIDGRSSLWTCGIFPSRGIIDATYTGELEIFLVNVSDNEFMISSGDRIAQIILHKQYHAYFNVVEKFSDNYNIRGTAGFGSSGK